MAQITYTTNLPCLFRRLFGPSFELREKERKKKERTHLSLLELSASPQQKRLLIPASAAAVKVSAPAVAEDTVDSDAVYNSPAESAGVRGTVLVAVCS